MTRKNIFGLFLLAALFVGCSKEKLDDRVGPPELTIGTTEYTIVAEGGEVQVPFVVNVDWQATVVYEEGVSGWLTLPPPASGAAGEALLTLSAGSRFATTERRAFVDISYAGESCRLTVVQQAMNDDTEITSAFDADFARELQKHGYVADAAHITFGEVKNIREIDLSVESDSDCAELTSLAGLEFFESLIRLDCSYNALTELNLSAHSALEVLNCRGNRLTALEFPANPALKELNCANNKLTKLDLSANPALETLHCDNNLLVSLEIAGCPNLAVLGCSNNRLMTLDVTGNTALLSLSCFANSLTSLDVSRNTLLTTLSCIGNRLTSLDVSANEALEELFCNSNCLETIDIHRNTGLAEFRCGDNPGKDGVFIVKAWFDDSSVPLQKFTYSSWEYHNETIVIRYDKWRGTSVFAARAAEPLF